MHKRKAKKLAEEIVELVKSGFKRDDILKDENRVEIDALIFQHTDPPEDISRHTNPFARPYLEDVNDYLTSFPLNKRDKQIPGQPES